MNLKVVLVEPLYEGNVGSVARAMKNFAASFQDAATLFYNWVQRAEKCLFPCQDRPGRQAVAKSSCPG
jgi:hypothetical protein